MWYVFFFRGGLKAQCETEAEAKEWIAKQFNPTEYWYEFIATEDMK